MPRAVAVGLPEPALQISACPSGYQSHFSHAGERIWPETNCYLDLWIETLHALGLDPVPAFACALSADHDGLQWTFLKQQPEDLRQLYGLEARRAVSIPGRSSLTFFDSSLPGAFRDLSNSFRFSKRTADGIEAVVEFVGSPCMIRNALIVNPRPGQANSGIRALAYPSDETDWTLEISSDVALRYVSIDALGWIPSDNFFHLLAATPYSVRLQRCCDQAPPLGKVASVDYLGTATITASA
jgi:Domain of unknown function (DUF1839)